MSCWGRHRIESVTSDKLYYDKGTRTREWYSGTYEFCTRDDCDYGRFFGVCAPYLSEVLPLVVHDNHAPDSNVLVDNAAREVTRIKFKNPVRLLPLHLRQDNVQEWEGIK